MVLKNSRKLEVKFCGVVCPYFVSHGEYGVCKKKMLLITWDVVFYVDRLGVRKRGFPFWCPLDNYDVQ